MCCLKLLVFSYLFCYCYFFLWSKVSTVQHSCHANMHRNCSDKWCVEQWLRGLTPDSWWKGLLIESPKRWNSPATSCILHVLCRYWFESRKQSLSWINISCKNFSWYFPYLGILFPMIWYFFYLMLIQPTLLKLLPKETYSVRHFAFSYLHKKKYYY